MPEKDAVILENWWPQPSKLVVRSGSVDWATGFEGPVETIVEYCPTDGLNELFAASAGDIYDITASGVVDTPVVSGQSNDRWQEAAITTPGGSFLFLFNGQDDPLLYDGTDWESVNDSSTNAITGVTTSLLIQGCLFKNRIYMVERDSLRVWYLPTSSIAGAATDFDLGAIFRRGGWLVGMYTWTIDAGEGADDHAVFLTSEGEVAVYAGTDPESAETWRLVGLFYLGQPIGRRCAVKVGGDLMVLCEAGVMPLGRALLSSSIDRRAAVSDKIQNSVNVAVYQYRQNFGWELCMFPEQNALILNIPAGGGRNFQYAQNSLTGAWTKFTGWDARTVKTTSLGLFFGDSNSVKKAWTGNIDGQSMIVADALQSFQDFGLTAINKYFTMIRPYVLSDGNPSILYGINGDYVPQEPTGSLTYADPGGMVWGQMIWGEMVWGGSIRPLSGWNTVGGVYNAAALRLKVQSNISNTEWASTSYVFQVAGIL